MKAKKEILLKNIKRLGKSKSNFFLPRLIAILLVTLASCEFDGLESVDNNIKSSPNLSDYGIFQGNPADLIPSNGFYLYELSSELFTDYAEKQRLIKLPPGEVITPVDSKLPDFPDGTILVKTFYYYHDARDTTKGKKIIETRLEIKSNSKWNVSVYLWNDEQTDAKLFTTGLNKTIHWIDKNGNGKVIAYHIPSTRECATCHNVSNKVTPIGPKLRNLNIDVTRNAAVVNQLVYFNDQEILDEVDPSAITILPDWEDSSNTERDRARAYMDVNCAHCHNSSGNGSESNLFLNYELEYGDTGISGRKGAIINQMERGQMPRLGTTIVHTEGLKIIRDYIDGL